MEQDVQSEYVLNVVAGEKLDSVRKGWVEVQQS